MSLAAGAISIVFLMACAVAARAAEWHVAPDGDDRSAGSRAAPFAGLMRAQEAAVPGDVVLVHGGTHRLSADAVAAPRGLYARVILLGKSGTRERPITYRAAPGERPVFDFSAIRPPGQRVAAFSVRGSWLRLEGFEVTGVQVTMKGHTQSICFESEGSHNVFARLAMHDGQAIGIYHIHGRDNLFEDCDAWNNHDHTSEDGRGGNVDGFGCHPSPGSTGNVFRRCRAWLNSDDGFDCLGAHEPVVFEHCVALWNGFTPQRRPAADGNGFKAGGHAGTPVERLPRPIPRHIVRFCIAAENRSSGFYANHHIGGIDWIHNTSFRNGTGYNLLNRLPDNRTDIPGRDHVLVGNLSFGDRRPFANLDAARCRLEANSFVPPLLLAAEHFDGSDPAVLVQPRKPDGSLPSAPFLRPRPGSPLIDAAPRGEFPWRGSAPDIGAVEGP